MAVAIRTITRLQDADDVNISLGAGVDEYALSWDNDTAKFVLRAVAAGATDHGALTGLTPDDDHTQYALLAGRAGGQTFYGGTAANESVTIHGTSNATRTTSYVLLQPTAGNVGIGTTAPVDLLHISKVNGAGDVGVIIQNYAVTDGETASLSFRLTTSTVDFGRIRVTRVSGSFSRVSIGATGKLDTLTIDSSGNVGIGTTAPSTILHAVSTTATTNALRDVLTLGSNVTGAGVGAAGLGASMLFTMETSTTVDTAAASVQAIIYEATHATRKFDLVGNAYDTEIREGWRVRGNGSAPAIGFLGATPIARIAHVADPTGGATVDAEARSAINSILTTLETFGFHATS